jgi:hypothetical protein
LMSTGRSKLFFYDDVAVAKYVSTMSNILANSIKTSPPIYLEQYPDRELDILHTHNGIYIDSESGVMYPLSLIRPELCKNYVYHTFDDWTTIPSALIMRKERRDILDAMNVIVSERMSFVDDYVQSLTLSDQCREHIFPVHTSNPRYLSLNLAKISGALAFLFFILCLAFCVFLCELTFVRWKPKVKTFRIVIRFKSTVAPNIQDLIFVKYAKINELLAYDRLSR